ncbi:MAG: HNH/ENDO VII family nuclease [Nocardioides sp.]|uniref:HNH/ENDO VII family nuclease n=1 Tax=Nocardioides sp. TaxID=35761 RepID=UPI003F0C08F5
MRVEVDTGSYWNAATVLDGANGSAASTYDTLIGKLSGFAGMGGDDKSSEDFVANYDGGAAATVGAISDLVTALGSLAVAADASATNHADADSGSVYARNAASDGGHTAVDPVVVAPYTPPSALGADSQDTPQFWDIMMDYLEGWAWPSADTGRLKEAASAWDAAASGIEALASSFDLADADLGLQRSPEIGKARSSVKEVKTGAADIAAACRELATACRDYANQVESTRETVKGLMKDLAIEVGITAVAAGIGSFFSFGAAAGGGAALIAARAANYARRIITAITAIRAVRAVLTVARTIDKLTDVTRILRKFKAARRMKGRVSGKLPDTGKPGSYGYDKDGKRLPYANNRPSYDKDQVNKVWDKAKDENGEVWVLDKDGKLVKIDWKPGDPQTGKWDMGHLPGEEYRHLRDEYLSGKISKEEFLRRYRDPDNYEVSHPGRNRSHQDEEGPLTGPRK